ncbi:MAG: hypothetical protein KGS61_07715 [Verrucomicrobia bacterium]|nr:hypothetical protein [Verrucomicrobiota bacterium]
MSRHSSATPFPGANFRNAGEIRELVGCDLLTIRAHLLDESRKTQAPLERKLSPEAAGDGIDPTRATIDPRQSAIDRRSGAASLRKGQIDVRTSKTDLRAVRVNRFRSSLAKARAD